MSHLHIAQQRIIMYLTCLVCQAEQKIQLSKNVTATSLVRTYFFKKVCTYKIYLLNYTIVQSPFQLPLNKSYILMECNKNN